MKKIILSVAVAAMALSTTASALEDIKVNGQAKLFYETANSGTSDLLNKNGANGEVVFKLGMTGKQGNVGFGTTVYQASTMGLEGVVVSAANSAANNLGGAATIGPATNSNTNGGLFVGEAYVTAPIANATLKFGKQELDTPLAFTERWNSLPNTFNAAVGIIPVMDNLTLVAAYIGQDNATSFTVDGDVTNQFNPGTNGLNNGAYALAAMLKTEVIGVNVWAYSLESLANAVWIDASMKAGPVALKAIAAHMMPKGVLDGSDDTTAFALSAGAKVAGWNVSGAVSTISEDGVLSVANTSTGFKKTKLPTAAVYLDGRSVAAPGATAIKVKAAGKIGSTSLAAQVISVSNDNGVVTDAAGGTVGDSAMEIDLIASVKLGDFNIKGIIMHRDFDQADAHQRIRLITSINF